MSKPLPIAPSSPVSGAVAPDRRAHAALAIGLAAAVVLLAASVLLWARHGTAVFFEMIAAGIAACF